MTDLHPEVAVRRPAVGNPDHNNSAVADRRPDRTLVVRIHNPVADKAAAGNTGDSGIAADTPADHIVEAQPFPVKKQLFSFWSWLFVFCSFPLHPGMM